MRVELAYRRYGVHSLVDATAVPATRPDRANSGSAPTITSSTSRKKQPMTDFDLNPDGPHGPARTAEAGQLFDDCSRFLTYATMVRRGGIEYPSGIYRLLGDLYAATGRFPQMCAQVEACLRDQEATRRLYDAQGRDVRDQIERAAAHLSRAEVAARALTVALQSVQKDINGLGVKEDGDA